MSKKVLIISGSPRKGNSDMLCEEFKRGAVEAGNEVEKVDLRSKRMSPPSWMPFTMRTSS